MKRGSRRSAARGHRPSILRTPATSSARSAPNAAPPRGSPQRSPPAMCRRIRSSLEEIPLRCRHFEVRSVFNIQEAGSEPAISTGSVLLKPEVDDHGIDIHSRGFFQPRLPIHHRDILPRTDGGSAAKPGALARAVHRAGHQQRPGGRGGRGPGIGAEGIPDATQVRRREPRREARGRRIPRTLDEGQLGPGGPSRAARETIPQPGQEPGRQAGREGVPGRRRQVRPARPQSRRVPEPGRDPLAEGGKDPQPSRRPRPRRRERGRSGRCSSA